MCVWRGEGGAHKLEITGDRRGWGWGSGWGSALQTLDTSIDVNVAMFDSVFNYIVHDFELHFLKMKIKSKDKHAKM